MNAKHRREPPEHLDMQDERLLPTYIGPDSLTIYDYLPDLREDESRALQIRELVGILHTYHPGQSLSVLLMDDSSSASAEILGGLVDAGIGHHDRLTVMTQARPRRAQSLQLRYFIDDAQFIDAPRTRIAGKTSQSLYHEQFDIVILGGELEEEVFTARSYGARASLYLLNADGPQSKVILHQIAKPCEPYFALSSQYGKDSRGGRAAMAVSPASSEEETGLLLNQVSHCTTDTGHASEYQCPNRDCPKPRLAALIIAACRESPTEDSE